MFCRYCFNEAAIAAVNVSIKQEAIDHLKQAVAGLIEANNRCHYIRSIELDNSGIKDLFNIEQVKSFLIFLMKTKILFRNVVWFQIKRKTDF